MKNKNPFTGSKILVVEDEESLAIGLEYNLSEEGYHVTRAGDGRMALELIESTEFDLIILDLMLPYIDGFEITRKVRDLYPQMPILILTARTRASDRVKGLEFGADDYMTKPFHLKELLLRVQGMLRRKTWYRSVASTIYHFGDNEINFGNLLCKANQQTINLTVHEAMILKYLIDHKDHIVSRSELLENVWNISAEVETRTVDNFIVRLRKYFEPDPEKPVYIKSVRGAGYIFSEGNLS
jgi:DNA-binding response OmpR family regulator